MLGRGGDSVDVRLTVGRRYSRVGGRVAEPESSEGMCVRDCERRRALEVDPAVREVSDESDIADRVGVSVDEREDSGDQNELLVTDDARLRADVELRDDPVLRTDGVELLAPVCRPESLRFKASVSSPKSGDVGGDGYATGDTQLGSSSWLEEPSSESPSPLDEVRGSGIWLRFGLTSIIESLSEVLSEPSPCTTWAVSLSISCASFSSVGPCSLRGASECRGARTSRTNARADMKACRAWSRKGNVWNTCT